VSVPNFPYPRISLNSFLPAPDHFFPFLPFLPFLMNTAYRKRLPGTSLDYFDARAAVDAIEPGAYDKLSYTARVHAEILVRRCDPVILEASLRQLIERTRDLDFPWLPARVVCHDILGQTALVDLAGLRDAIAEQGGDPAQVNPVVPVQLIVDHSLAVECGGFDPDAFAKNRAIEDGATKIASTSSTGPGARSGTST
jgi:aconitate hydratase